MKNIDNNNMYVFVICLQWPCPKCCYESGNNEGHRGRHRVMMWPCPKCCLESGNLEGHRGRHRVMIRGRSSIIV